VLRYKTTLMFSGDASRSTGTPADSRSLERANFRRLYMSTDSRPMSLKLSRRRPQHGHGLISLSYPRFYFEAPVCRQ
jgi:hypothetical protein